ASILAPEQAVLAARKKAARPPAIHSDRLDIFPAQPAGEFLPGRAPVARYADSRGMREVDCALRIPVYRHVAQFRNIRAGQDLPPFSRVRGAAQRVTRSQKQSGWVAGVVVRGRDIRMVESRVAPLAGRWPEEDSARWQIAPHRPILRGDHAS